ncbi:TetR/AcrR family transcriptional regulator [Tessaracoccus sp. OS52]|uniref:TetR/AcrR family transcriptional regulator n=1 Tax=Tessaracoccus sp. OS52 TaxID=2886691 RepID=UPI001D121887|nr:TetR/AcrR family transcriptional regulator [Tessaracoccus sp. OS52]MCC2594017.1 TetR/AcrR family transcriptional regulator [Tessaracoccus sp. OS52]
MVAQRAYDLNPPQPERPPTAKGRKTRQRILDSATKVFAEHGYHDASIVKITEGAGVALGTFYLYFEGKFELFREVVEDLNHRVRRAMSEAGLQGHTRSEIERAGFRAFFEFSAEHPELHRIIRQAEFVDPGSMRRHYHLIAEGYVRGLKTAQRRGEVGDIDPEVAAWAFMGIGEIIAMRWLVWPADDGAPTTLPEHVLDQLMVLVDGALNPPRSSRQEQRNG